MKLKDLMNLHKDVILGNVTDISDLKRSVLLSLMREAAHSNVNLTDSMYRNSDDDVYVIGKEVDGQIQLMNRHSSMVDNEVANADIFIEFDKDIAEDELECHPDLDLKVMTLDEVFNFSLSKQLGM